MARDIEVRCPFCLQKHKIDCPEYSALKVIYCDPSYHHDYLKSQDIEGKGSRGCGRSFVVNIKVEPIVSVYKVPEESITYHSENNKEYPPIYSIGSSR